MPSLEDMFDMDVDDKAMVNMSRKFDSIDYDDVSNPNVMMSYYRKLFPFKSIFLWLNKDHAPSRQWTHREIAFTLQNDAYLRYNSFSNAEDFKKETLRLNPARFEIGPIYSGRPKDKRTLNKATFKPLLRELVFDIDMTDYDPVRTCCSDKKICLKCWKFIIMAAKVVDHILRDDFGFQHLLWVYSGRRGIHLWVSDTEAMALTDDQRRAMVNYIDIVRGGANKEKKVNLPRPLHPSVGRSLAILKPYFDTVILQEQEVMATEQGSENMLRLFPEQEWAAEVRSLLQKAQYKGSSTEKWKRIDKLGEKYDEANTNSKKPSLKSAPKSDTVMEDVILQYTYPRIDLEVSKHLNHLLKAPFCIHPGTGRVCIPLENIEAIERFDPEKVPTVGQLLRELDAKPGAGWEATSLKPFVDIMDRHAERLVKETRDRKKRANARSMEF